MRAPEGLSFRSHYWDDRGAKESFKEFLVTIHGLDLSLWERRGFWDHENYIAFSLFEGDRMVATTNLYSMDMIVEGRRRRLGQFSGVGTLPEYRRRGLNRWLTEQALSWAAPTHDGFFLFADHDALPFYERCGFLPVAETVPILKVDPPPPRPGLEKLDPENQRDLERIHRLASERTPVSEVLGAWTARLLMFHCLYTLRDDLYFVPDLDVAVFFRIEGSCMTVFDIVGTRVPTFADLHPYLSRSPHDEVRFRFLTDKLSIEPGGTESLDDRNAHVYPPFRIPEPDCQFPYACHA